MHAPTRPMTQPILTVPISLRLGEDRLTLGFDHPDVLPITEPEPGYTLGLDPRQQVVFEAADFVANGTTYRVRATSRAAAAPAQEWRRSASGCQSPSFAPPQHLTLEFTATPASTSASARTTSVVLIIKKGKPLDL
jgi:hypothetical protein